MLPRNGIPMFQKNTCSDLCPLGGLMTRDAVLHPNKVPNSSGIHSDLIEDQTRKVKLLDDVADVEAPVGRRGRPHR